MHKTPKKSHFERQELNKTWLSRKAKRLWKRAGKQSEGKGCRKIKGTEHFPQICTK
jgi:hypothetical protein